jgi:hypothetical protein
MSPGFRAGIVYGAAAFGCGMLLGPLRVLMLEPRLGGLAAVALEAVPMLVALALLAPWIARRHGLGADRAPLLRMGGWALGLVLLLDVLGASLLGGLGAWIAGLATPPGMVGILLLAALALMPVLLARPRLPGAGIAGP